MQLLGLPLYVWGLACLALAIVWVIFWPHDRLTTTGGVQFVILRWFHALTWLLLAIAAFVAYFDLLGGRGSARLIAFAALIVYLIFMATLVRSRSSSSNRRRSR